MQPLELRYWAKSPPEGSDRYHPVPYHCLDVAAAGRAILEARPSASRRLALVSGLPRQDAVDLTVLLLAFHDLGKLADGFQGLRPDLMLRLQGSHRVAPYDSNAWKHDSVGQAVLGHLVDRGTILGLSASSKDSLRLTFTSTWLSAAMGHHGKPTISDASKHRFDAHRAHSSLSLQFPPQVLMDLEALVADLQSFLLPRGVDPWWFEHRKAARELSWLLTGLAVNADWIGSSPTWFPALTERHSLQAYFESVARPQAEAAIAEAGVREKRAAVRIPFQALWDGYSPTPLQEATDRIPLEEGPQLFIVEEVTGGGKTEAAFALAHRLVSAGRAEGVYVALPTMATANAMYHRLETAHRKLFAADETSSLILAHARRHLHLGALEAAAGSGDPGADRHESASAQCTRWLADSRKKALLADVGIGTIDQALLAVLRSRHQSLRLWGLSSKVLIVDEVHAADPYVLQLLAQLLEIHAALGGSAILLSATLAAAQRQLLVSRFAGGAQGVSPELEDDLPYPCLTAVSRETCRTLPLTARAEATRTLAVALTDDLGEVERRLQQAVDGGGCACWIRNTVADARDAAAQWAERLGSDRVHLFHSRFTVDDRERIEQDVLRRFGPASGPVERAGQLLIATQVVEQSLDLDFDTLVSDLAPIDLLLQRAGRLRRHRRDHAGARSPGPDQRGLPELLVYAPLPTHEPSPRWFESFLPGAAKVYPDHGRLWLGARWLADHPQVDIPGDMRVLIEHVYGDDAFERIPPALLAHHDRVDGTARADKSVAIDNAISFREGYKPQMGTDTWRDDLRLPTRLGEDSIIVRLARVRDGRIEPWHADGPHAWERSEVRAAAWLVAPGCTSDPALVARVLAELPDEGKWSALVVLEPAGQSWVGTALAAGGAHVEVQYDSHLGLQLNRGR